LIRTAFGSVTIDGNIYEKDIIIHVNGKISKRKKKKSKHLKPSYGHTPLSDCELDFLEKEKPEVVYIGKGYDSALPITAEALQILKDYESVLLPTPQVVERLEQEKRKFVAIIHVTC